MMDEDNAGDINYEEFEAWFCVRTGDDDPDVPVLPEYMVMKVDQLIRSWEHELHVVGQPAEHELGHEHRSGKELWNWLKPRLRSLVMLQKQWGSVHDVYGSKKGSMFEEQPIPKGIRDPDSTFSGWWDLGQIIFLLYISWAVPLRVGLSIDVANWSFWFFFELIVDVYFWIDLVLNFRTAYWAQNGTLEVDPREIKWHYLKSWFVLDFVSCIPVNYITVFDPSLSHLKAFKSIRLLRLFKLLRLARLKRILERHEDSGLQAYLGLIMTMFGTLLAAHMMACFWYLTGTVGRTYVKVLGDGQTEEIEMPGWVPQDSLWCGGGSNICTMDLVGEHIGWDIRYVRAMYTIFQNEFAYTEAEWAFGCASVIVTGFIFGGLTGVIATLGGGSGASEEERMLKVLSIKAWMSSKGISKRDRAKIMAHVTTQMDSGATYNEAEILDDLPSGLAGEVSLGLGHIVALLYDR
jgi:hypothetical protein